MMDERMRELERRSRAAFDDSVESLDAATRSRLARSRARALEELEGRRPAWAAGWLPAGVAAAAAVVGAMLWLSDDGRAPARGPALAALEDLDLVAGGEDFEMLEEDGEFYAWALDQVDDGVG